MTLKNIEDEPPPAGKRVILYGPKYGGYWSRIGWQSFFFKGDWVYEGDRVYELPTHWMEIPEGPKYDA